VKILDSLVIGSGQAGLASSYELTRRGIDHLVLDANPGPGGAWQHRWDSLIMKDVHGVADLPGQPAPEHSGERANTAIPAYFGEYERRFELPVIHGVPVETVTSVSAPDGGPDLLRVDAAVQGQGACTWLTRTLINATGTWTRPFIPYYPGALSFEGEQFHTAAYPGVDHVRGKRVLVVGGGASAVQFLGEIAPVTDVLWVTRREPVWHDGGIDGLAVVTAVEERVIQGLPPESVVKETGLVLRPQEQAAAALGVYDRRLPMFSRVEPHGVRWDGDDADPGGTSRFERVDVILWATGFRAALDHLAPLGLRSEQGGVALRRIPGNVQDATTTAADPRVNLVGYGPSASTIGASRVARQAALAVDRYIADASRCLEASPT
jgi:hypothetical protein